jgi:hypothetical protein
VKPAFRNAESATIARWSSDWTELGPMARHNLTSENLLRTRETYPGRSEPPLVRPQGSEAICPWNNRPCRVLGGERPRLGG